MQAHIACAIVTILSSKHERRVSIFQRPPLASLTNAVVVTLPTIDWDVVTVLRRFSSATTIGRAKLS